MFEYFTDCSRQAVALANDLAIRAGHSEITPEHLILGVMGAKQNGEQPARIGIALICGEQNAKLIEDEVLAGLSPTGDEKAGWNQSAKNAIQTAILVAGEKQPVRVGHLILGVLMQVCPAATVLGKYGIHHKNLMKQMKEAMQVANEKAETK